MSFDREFDKKFDQAFESTERGISSFFSNRVAPFFQSVVIGFKEFIKKSLWKSKRFVVSFGLFMLLCGVLVYCELKYLPDLYADNIVWNWLYHRQQLTPFPLSSVLIVMGVLQYFNKHGREVLKLRYRLQLAFERCGLYSRRKVTKDNQTTPEYPTLYKEMIDNDGGKTFIFKNVGIPLEEWKKVQASLESSLETKISNIDLYKGNPGYIKLIIGGLDIPRTVEFNEALLKHGDKNSVVVGAAKEGIITHDFKSTPHLLIGGATGAGKTVVANSIAYQCIDKLNGILYLVDFKGGADYTAFEDIGINIISKRLAVARLTERLKKEHEARVQLFRKNRVRNIVDYNDKFPKKKLRRCFVLIDELAELTDKKGCPKDEQELLDIIIGDLSSIARLTRSTGINLLLATQRPDANVVPGQIKSNVTGRLCGYFKDDVAYRIVLDYTPFPLIPSPKEWPGRFVYSLGSEDFHIQTPYFQDKHVNQKLSMDYETGVLTLQGVIDDIESEADEVSPVPSQKKRYINTEI